MTIDNFNQLINALPYLVIYIVPGYITLSVIRFILCGKKDDSNNLIIKCIVISYIIVNFEKLFCQIVGIQGFDITSVAIIIITVLFSIITGYGYSILIMSERFNSFLNIIKIRRTTQSDFLSDITDFELGNWIRVYIPAEEIIYQGKLKKIQDIKEDNQYFILISNYSLYNYSGKMIKDCTSNNIELAALNINSTNRIEIIYDPQSTKISD